MWFDIKYSGDLNNELVQYSTVVPIMGPQGSVDRQYIDEQKKTDSKKQSELKYFLIILVGNLV